ncbi:MAG: DUF885 domain-containing protein [Gammaproteobacteria bacterium]|nr:DUF885 domain-containing protein [Gammaproteobacteria bacterium]MDH3480727.1 DUF885 domain-containing protein [Gammaproteobacteria bacterium]
MSNLFRAIALRAAHPVLLVAALALAACGGSENQAESTRAENQPWEAFTAVSIAEYYSRNPELAVDVGLHEYDGQMSDFSLEAADAYATWIDGIIASAESYDGLTGIEALEREYMLSALRGELFWIRESGFLTNNPVYYAWSLGFDIYIDRDYAPLDERIIAYTKYVSQIPTMLETMRKNLEPPLPAPYVETAHSIFKGLADYLKNTVPGLFSTVEDEQAQRRFAAANSAAAEAAEQTVDWLDGLRASANDDFALGEERFLEMLRATQGVDITLADLKVAGELNLKQNLDQLREACAEFAPGESARNCVLKVQNRKPPGGAVAGATRQLPDLRRFLEDNDIVSIPGTEEALVAEAPPHRRSNFAYINIPGPFESGLPSVYYIAPPDPAWSPEDQHAYIPGETDLLATSVHEVWPGHFLQFLHANRAENNVGQHFATYSFVEGWAHYTEQMMIDAGLGDGDPEYRIGQLLNALLRNVRYLSAIGLHAEGMTVEESQAMFADVAFQDFGNASQQAYRGTYDPGYLNYTLGKLMINKLREDWTTGRGGEESWGRFHDQFLSFGSPPVPLIREQMLGKNYDGDSALLPN